MDTRKTEITDLIAAERREFADVLSGLPAEAWDAPTLCEGWNVRHVVAHMTMPFRTSLPKFVAGMLRARGNFDKAADRWARGDAAKLTPRQLTACVRDNAGHRWKPPGDGFEAALSHDVIHGLDVTVALGLDRTVPLERVEVILTSPGSEKGRKFFGVDLSGIELRATDLDWSLGEGTVVAGKAQHLLLLTSGRLLPPGLLDGDAAARFTRA